jgi:hypothetical protein
VDRPKLDASQKDALKAILSDKSGQ